ncbi:uncharacterized protein LOC123546233 [Mercenaria mercenaria]|uniref:uncharacterized protein LOC123546233 n=1 Tax=Mercenaria mercenaria TaxID=6596 RepID=UPI00234F09F5|nr:uncharacterized protein LOC123546233 [Mercenaria mercenaria]
MGIPMANVTYHMKAVINECIQHIETRKIRVSEARQKIVADRDKIPNFDDVGAYHEDKGISILNNLQKNEDVKKGPTAEHLSDPECNPKVDSVAIKIDNANDNVVENDSKVLHHIQEMIVGHETCNDKENFNKICTNKSASYLNEDGVEFIHLEMKNNELEKEELDDTSGFFDDVEAMKGDCTEKFENLKGDQSESTEDDRNKTDQSGVFDEAVEDEENSNDSGAIITDIENLKRDIENDLKMLKDKKERQKQVNIYKHNASSTQNMDQEHADIDEEFDSCFDDSDSEFSDCFEENHYDKRTTYEKEDNRESKNIAGDEEFETVEFIITNSNVKENMKRKINDSTLKPSHDRPPKNLLDSLNSKADAAKANQGSFDINIQKCHKEYCKTKEVLGIAVNHEALRKVDQILKKNVELNNIEKKTQELSNVSQNQMKAVIGKENLKISSHDKPVKSDCIEGQRSGHGSLQGGQIQQINALLGSLGKTTSTAPSKTNVSALKFRSRHFREEESEPSGGSDKYIPNIDHVEHSIRNVINRNEDANNFIVKENNVIDEISPYFEQSSGAQQDIQNSLHTAALVSERKLNVTAGKPPEILNLDSLNCMLKDINNISNRNMDSRTENLQTAACHSKGRDTDFREISENGSGSSSKPDMEIRIVKTKVDHCMPENMSSLKGTKPVSVKHSSVFLRSRHMNTEAELNEKSEVLENFSRINPLDQEISFTVKAKHIDDCKCTGEQVCENKSQFEDMKEEMKHLVWGVNYDGDDDISRAVCDIVLKQSKDGNPRLNTNLVDCYTRAGAHTASLEVIDGVVVQTSIETMMTLQKIHGKHCRALLVNADLTMTFRHKGYKPVKVKEFSSLERFSCGKSKLDSWQTDIIDVLKMLFIDVLLVKGNISDDVVSICEQLDIVAMDTIPYKQLVQLSEAMEVDMVTYVTLATEDNVCTGISISPLQQNWCNKVDRSWYSKVDTVISLAESNPQTVILYGVSPVLIDLKEQELWECLLHVSSVLHHGYLVLGAGQTEEDCVGFLSDKLESIRRDQKSVTSHNMQYKQVVLDSMIPSFQDYSRLFRDSSLEAGYALEGFKAKVKTWKLAIDTVTTITNIDSYIVTGITEEDTDQRTL